MDKKQIDFIEKVGSAEALTEARRVIKTEGIPVGMSSGAAIIAALRHARKPENKGKTIVAIIPSTTERYLSTFLAEEERAKAAQLPTEQPQDKYLEQAAKNYEM